MFSDGNRLFGVNYETLSKIKGDRNSAWSELLKAKNSFDLPLYEMREFESLDGVREAFEYFYEEALILDDRYSVLVDGKNTFPNLNNMAHVLYYEGNRELLFGKKVSILAMKHPSLQGKSDLFKIADEMGDLGYVDVFPLEREGFLSSFAINYDYQGPIIGVGNTIGSVLSSTRIISQKESLYISLYGPGVNEERFFSILRNDLVSIVSDGALLVEEKDGGPMWRVFDRFIALSKPSMIVKEFSKNPNSRFSRRDILKAVKYYGKKGDLKHLFQKKGNPGKNSDGDSGPSLFDTLL